eukprot:6462340-Amphidinium_carterae.1
MARFLPPSFGSHACGSMPLRSWKRFWDYGSIRASPSSFLLVYLVQEMQGGSAIGSAVGNAVLLSIPRHTLH